MQVDVIREALQRGPFVPFLLRMNDGRVIMVPHPDHVAVGRRHVVFIDPDTDASIFLEPVLIASLEYVGTPKSTPEEGGGGTA
jgi:hypothetical protein